MKNLANSKPEEALRQMFKIKKAAEKWLKDIGFSEIRKRMPELVDIKNLTGEERDAAIRENQERMKKQSKENLMQILDNALEKDAEATITVLKLACFVDPDDDTHTMSEYLKALGELISDEGVISFFSSLVQLDLPNL